MINKYTTTELPNKFPTYISGFPSVKEAIPIIISVIEVKNPRIKNDVMNEDIAKLREIVEIVFTATPDPTQRNIKAKVNHKNTSSIQILYLNTNCSNPGF